MKKLLLLLLCVPSIGFGQSFKPTPCECARYRVAEMQWNGFMDRKDLDKPDIKTLELLEEKYKECKQFRDLFIDENNKVFFFKDAFVDCILDDDEFSDFCKCTYMIMPALMESFAIGFSKKEDVQLKREQFWKNKMSYCKPYGKIDEWSEDLRKDGKKCKNDLLDKVLK